MAKIESGKVREGTGPAGEPMVGGIQMSGLMLMIAARGYDGREAEVTYITPGDPEPEDGVLVCLRLKQK